MIKLCQFFGHADPKDACDIPCERCHQTIDHQYVGDGCSCYVWCGRCDKLLGRIGIDYHHKYITIT